MKPKSITDAVLEVSLALGKLAFSYVTLAGTLWYALQLTAHGWDLWAVSTVCMITNTILVLAVKGLEHLTK